MYLHLSFDQPLEYLALYQTASTLTFATYMLTQHPDIARRLREEILNTVGRGRPTFEQMKQMKFLRAFINGMFRYYFRVSFRLRCEIETLRLYPAVYVSGLGS
jgi:cytochrome P450